MKLFFLLCTMFFALSMFAQKNTYEAKWVDSYQPNGSAEIKPSLLYQAVNQPLTCVANTTLCVAGAHGKLYLADFGSGIFLIDDEGYVYLLQGAYRFFVAPEIVREFANGVH